MSLVTKLPKPKLGAIQNLAEAIAIDEDYLDKSRQRLKDDDPTL